jgi:hypothetical protein
MLRLLLSCVIGAGGRSNMLGSCAADHLNRRDASRRGGVGFNTSTAALALVFGGAGPHSPLSSSAADRPNRHDTHRRRCVGSASIQAAALALLSLSRLAGWRPGLAVAPQLIALSGVMLTTAAASAQLRYKQLLSLSGLEAQAPTHRLALAQPTALTSVVPAAAAASARPRFKNLPPLLRRLSSDTSSFSRSRALVAQAPYTPLGSCTADRPRRQGDARRRCCVGSALIQAAGALALLFALAAQAVASLPHAPTARYIDHSHHGLSAITFTTG